MRNRWALLWLLAADLAKADGGTVRIDEETGPFRITVMSAPEPLRAGAADLSVLVQRKGGGSPALDAEVEVRLVACFALREWLRRRSQARPAC